MLVSCNLAPPEVFGMVERGLYRSNAPGPLHFPFLRTLKAKTVVYASPELPTRALLAFLDAEGIALRHIGATPRVEQSKWKPVSDELVKEALEIMLDTSTHPVILICTSGVQVNQVTPIYFDII
jgi:protein tyrosine/serine phosphatase